MLILIPGVPYAVNTDKLISIARDQTGSMIAVCLEGISAQVELEFESPEEAEKAMMQFISEFNGGEKSE